MVSAASSKSLRPLKGNAVEHFCEAFLVMEWWSDCLHSTRLAKKNVREAGTLRLRPGWADTTSAGAVRPCHYPRFSCPQSARPTGSNVLRLVSRQRKEAPLPARPAGSEVSFTSIPAGQAGTGIASSTPFWLIEKRIHLRGKHAGVFKSG